MQNAFMLPEVAHSPCLMAQEIVPNINRLAQAVRDTGGTVVWIKTAYTDETLQSWSDALRHDRARTAPRSGRGRSPTAARAMSCGPSSRSSRRT